MLVDTHTHINFRAFKDDADEVIQNALKQGIWMVLPSSQRSTSERAVELAEKYPEGVYAAVGLHPVHLVRRNVKADETQMEETTAQSWMEFEARAEEFDHSFYRSLAESSEKVVAIGECGLDSFGLPRRKSERREAKEKQREVLRAHINLALELDLPVIFHCRGALDDLSDLLFGYEGSVRGVVHSFTGTAEQTERFLDMGLYIGFNGIIFKKSLSLPDFNNVIASVPMDRIVVETDAPYLVPPQAGVDRNEPAFVSYVADEISRIKGISFQDVAVQTTRNARDLFRV